MYVHRVCLLLALFGLIQGTAQTPKPIEVAPGVTLPSSGEETVFALDQTAAEPSLVHIRPHEVYVNTHAGSNFLRAQVFAGPQAGVELHGPHADIVLLSTGAVFFVRAPGDEAGLISSRLHLVWLDPNKKTREVASFSANVFGGQHRRYVIQVPTTTEKIEGTDWIKITPTAPLLPGEFAIVSLPADANQMPGWAYDFGIAGKVKPGADAPYTVTTDAPVKH